MNWKLDYGAKNSYGSMVREQVSFTTIGNSIFIDGASYDVKDFKIGFNFIKCIINISILPQKRQLYSRLFFEKVRKEQLID